MSGRPTVRARREGGSVWRWGLGLVLVLTLLGGGFSAAPSALAAAITVDSAADDGSGGCTLREAIESANTDTAVGGCTAGSGTDTITFTNGLPSPITLNGTQLEITTSMTIQGPGAAVLAVSGNDLSRVFSVTDGNEQDDLEVIVTISGLTIQNGHDFVEKGEVGQGGGIYASRVKLTLQADTIKENVVEGGTVTDCCNSDAGGQGGGIYAESTTLTLVGTTVGGNNVAEGGTYSYQQGCCGGNAGGQGGGIYAVGGRVVLQTSTVTNNTAGGGVMESCCESGGQGGGIYAVDGSLVLEASTVSDNTAASGTQTNCCYGLGGQGGGIYADYEDVTLSNTAVTGNHAQGALNSSSSDGGIGGGLFVRYSRLTVIGGQFANNHADGSGTGSADGGDGGMGGGIFADSNLMTLKGVTITGNVAAGAPTPSLYGAGAGGGLFIVSGYCGGGEGDRAATAYSLASPALPIEAPMISNSIISGNTAEGSTGGVEGSQARGGAGGGVLVVGGCGALPVGINNTTFDGNHALAGGGTASEGGTGGGLQIGDGEGSATVVATGNLFVNNTAAVGTGTTRPYGTGGAIGVGEGGTLFLENSTLAANTADRTGAALFTSLYGLATVTNVTVVGNTAPAGGGQVATEVIGHLTLTNTIVSTGGTTGNCAGPVTDGGNNIDDANTCAFGVGSHANTNPLLGALADNGGPTKTFHPQPTSPALDAGNNVACPTTDQRGISRPQGATCDIGAVEYLRVAPTLTSLDPSSKPQGSAAFVLTVNGTNFVSGLSAIRFGDSTLPTTFVSPTQLTAEVPANLLTTAGTVGVTVTTSGPGGGTSNSLPFQVTGSAPYTVTVTVVGTGTVNPGTSQYAGGALAAFAATPGTGQVFIGWKLDGVYVGYATPLDFTVNSNRTLVATFVPRPVFNDVPTSDADWQAITFLAALGIVNPNGVNGSGNFEPGREVVRAEVAAFIARTFGWDKEFHRNNFPDRCDPQGQNCVDDELWNNVAALADYGVVGGYTDEPTCASAGTSTPCYLPRDPVLRLQVASVVARSFIKTPDLRPTGFWDRLAADLNQYTNVPNSGSQRSDLTTYRANAGPIPGQASDTNFPSPLTSSDRRFVVAVLYQAFDSWYKVDRVP